MSERIIPVLTGTDSRLTTTLEGMSVWQVFDGSTSTGFATGLYFSQLAAPRDIVWLGDTAYVIESIQFTGYSESLWEIPTGVDIYGSNDSGATWTLIQNSTGGNRDETVRSITSGTAYKGFKFTFVGMENTSTPLGFVEMIVLGNTSSSSVSVHIDTQRKLKTVASVAVDTKRRAVLAQSVAVDTRRRLHTVSSVNVDTIRRKKSSAAVTVDTSRRRSIPFGYQQRGVRNIVVTVDTERRLN